MQDCSISIVNALAILQSCTEASRWVTKTLSIKIRRCNGQSTTSVRLLNSWRHHTPCPWEWAMGCLLWEFWRKLMVLQDSTDITVCPINKKPGLAWMRKSGGFFNENFPERTSFVKSCWIPGPYYTILDLDQYSFKTPNYCPEWVPFFKKLYGPMYDSFF